MIMTARKLIRQILFCAAQAAGGYARGEKMAERQGFEPWDPRKGQRISNPSRSTAPAPLQGAHSLRPASGGDKSIRRHRLTVVALLLLSGLGSSSCSETGLSKLEAVKRAGELVVLTRKSPPATGTEGLEESGVAFARPVS